MNQPVFTAPLKQYLICGGRRTGTTLLTAILSSDERANPLGQEAQILTRIVQGYRWGRQNFDQFGRSFFDDRDMFRAFYREIVDRFSREVAARISPGEVLVLKNPEFSRVLPEMVELFPEATFLATARDPRDQIASELEVGMRRLSDSGQDPCLVERDIGRLARQYMNYYREILELHRGQPGRIHIVRYEDLVLESDRTLKTLRTITGLNLNFAPDKPWSRVSEFANLHTTPSRSELFGAPIDTRSVRRFWRDLTAEEIAVVERACAGLMAEFAYRPHL